MLTCFDSQVDHSDQAKFYSGLNSLRCDYSKSGFGCETDYVSLSDSMNDSNCDYESSSCQSFNRLKSLWSY